MMETSARSQSGVTLVDVVIAAAIVAVICAVAYPGFMVANDTMATSGQQVRLEGSADRILKALVSRIRTGHIVAQSPPGVAPWIDVHPPRTGIELSKLDADGAVPWDTSVTNRISFRETGLLKESDARRDFNHDGDQSDVFATGLVEMTTPQGSRPITERGRVILGQPTYREDLDGDGTEDPLFEIDNRRFTIRMNLVRRDEKGHFHQTRLVHSVYLRNVQE